MADDEFEENGALEVEELDADDLDEDALEEEFEDEDEVIADDALEEVADVEVEIPVAVVPAEGETVATEEEDDEVVDLDEELHPDDVEEALDVVLRERTVAAGLEDEEEEEEEPDERGDGGTKIVPRRPGEFLCSSCFLVLPRHQLADEKRMLCRDCV